MSQLKKKKSFEDDCESTILLNSPKILPGSGQLIKGSTVWVRINLSLQIDGTFITPWHQEKIVTKDLEGLCNHDYSIQDCLYNHKELLYC